MTQKHICKYSMSIAAIFIISLFAVFTVSGHNSPVYAQEGQTKNVLVLNSYHKGFVQTDNIVKGIESVLESEKNEMDIELRIEYMDSKSVNYETKYKEKLYDLYKHKYGNETFDLIISSDDNAFNFLLEYHKDLFPDTPIVFCGVNYLDAPKIIDPDVFTGIIELQSIRETIDLALSLHPETTEIIFVVDNTPSGTYIWNQIQELFKYYENIQMTHIDGSQSMEQVEDKVSKLTDDTIVLFGPFNQDKSGQYYSNEESAQLISKASARPMYGYSVSVLPYGIVGGKVFGGFYHGQVTAEMAQRILNGENVQDIPVLTEPQTQYMFDYEQMKRWGIDASDLPRGSIVVNRHYSFYEENKMMVFGVIMFMFFQTLIIVSTLMNISKRRKAEEKFKLIFNTAKDAIFLSDKTGMFVDVNKAACKSLGYSKKELLKMNNKDVDIDETGYKEFLKIKEGKIKESKFEVNHKRKDGTIIPVEITGSLFYTDGQKRFLAVARDITERKKANKKIEASLHEKEVLLKEIHHRVKNNLQIVSSLLDMQAKATKNKDITQILSESKNRINAMALIHSQLYENKDLSKINMKGFISRLLKQLFQSHNMGNIKISQNIHIGNYQFPIDTAIPIGLIINELLTNSIKHGFTGRKEGKIDVALTASKKGECTLTVSDDGIGLPTGFDIDKSKTLGLHLIKILVENQLQGTMKITCKKGKGTMFNIKFNLENQKR